MLQTIVARALEHRRVVIVLATAVVLYGVWTARHAKLDVLPDFAPPQVEIQTEAPGFAPDQVELLVTLPIETALGGVAGLQALRSESIQGLSVITAVFRDDVDLFKARQVVAENLADIGPRLPAGVQPPRLSPLTSATMDVLKIGLTSRTRSPMDLRTLADWTIRPRLLMVPGVARVNVFGGEVRQVQVQVSAAAIHAHGLTLADVVAAARAATTMRGAGFVDTAAQRIVLGAAGNARTSGDVGATVVASSAGAPLRLADVATVLEAPAPQFGDALIQGEPGVLLTLSAAYGANTVEVTRGLEDALDELRPLLAREGAALTPALHRPASFVEAAIANLRGALLLGTLLVVLVLLVFLQNVRAAVVSLTAIPLSLLAAVIVLTRCGVTLNTMSLGGLAIAIGEVVDDAIIDVDNIVRRLRANRGAPRPRSAFAVALAASLEVRRAVVFATLAVALVFLPLLALGGLQGKFFAPLALSYLLAVVASLVVALTVTPALALTLLGAAPPRAETPRMQAAVGAAYARVVRWVWRRERLVLGVVAGAAVTALTLVPFLGGEFLPDFQEHHLVVQLVTAPGTSIAAMRRIGGGFSRALLELPGVRTVEQQIGRAEQGEDTWGPNRSELHVELAPDGDDTATTARVRAVLAAMPGVESEVLTFLGDRISESISGETAAVVVNVFGDDLDALDTAAHAVAGVLAATPGAVDVRLGTPALASQQTIALRADALARYGFRPADVLDQLQISFAGVTVGQVYRGGQPVDVVVVLTPEERDDPARVGGLLVQSAAGLAVPLRQLADVGVASARDVIRHEGGRRRQTVTCNVGGRDVTSFVAAARDRIARVVTLPRGAYVTLGGTAQARAAAARDLALHGALGLLGVVLLLAVVAGNWRNLVLLLLNLPLALAGGVVAAAITATGLSLGALVGFVTLFGITLRNGIMMMAHYQQLVGEEGLPWTAETALRGAGDRLIPIVMTALVTGLGLLPVALASGRAGGEIDGPMATVILGGLVTSTLLNLLVLPTLARRFARFAPAPPR
jgi:CzcA family heavy metal efflux pump